MEALFPEDTRVVHGSHRPIQRRLEYQQVGEVNQFRNRLASKGLIGVSTFACLHQLC